MKDLVSLGLWSSFYIIYFHCIIGTLKSLKLVDLYKIPLQTLRVATWVGYFTFGNECNFMKKAWWQNFGCGSCKVGSRLSRTACLWCRLNLPLCWRISCKAELLELSLLPRSPCIWFIYMVTLAYYEHRIHIFNLKGLPHLKFNLTTFTTIQ